MNDCNRRQFLQGITAAGVCTAAGLAQASPAKAHPDIPFGFSLYGMKTLDVDKALRTCAEIGYDCVELSLLAGWPTEPKNLSATERRRLRDLLESLNLKLPAVMENLLLLADDAKHKDNLERLKNAAELAMALSPKDAPVIETVLGTKPDQWDAVKNRMVDRLGTWAEVAKAGKVVVTIKAHINNALHTPQDALWLVKQVGSPWIKLVYDYSHFELQNISMDDSVDTMISETRFVHIKDTEGDEKKFHFLLPGEGHTNYPRLLKRLKRGGYRDSVVVEVSAQISNQPGYDPIRAAKQCYEKIAPTFKEAGLFRD